MKLSLTPFAERLATSYWLVPALCVFASIGLSQLAQAIDARLPQHEQTWYLFQGGPEGARSVLSAVASSMMTFAGLVFSVTILVLQQASNQFSPRILRTFLRDRKSQLSLGIFVGTFVYALLAMRSVRGTSENLEIESHVPSLSVWLAVVFVLISVGTFIFFIHHVAQSIRAVVILGRIRDETCETMERMYPEGVGHDAEDAPLERPQGMPSLVVPHAGRSGVLVTLDEEQLLRCAQRAEVTMVVVPMMGDFVPHGSALFEVWGDAGSLDLPSALASVQIGRERTLQQDTAFGFRQLVDIAERALSPGTNDPSTAVQAIDQLHDLLRRLVLRRFPSLRRLDDQGVPRLICPRPDFNDYVRLSMDEIREYGEGSIQVARRLRFLLEDLLRVAPDFRRAELERQRALLDANVTRGFADARVAEEARRAGPQGHGPR
ncbi:DUF2254 domain-containing protein [Myxococcus sp. AM009]|uniref:DUF2254 domain-containing protein n=1 Tax=unclassified Myxococcus TaxID=2648731 RepID=UPI00159593EC|nr:MULTISPECIES: DUF2254 domain-containing protein [unclassified Myxococcus]NVJ02180.1 DUF2254 domain-containing protein [Myxococcus sp. AM009]NVJ18816.1 DUF2254 domain-containing protein [Myxococcus sp. AM010]